MHYQFVRGLHSRYIYFHDANHKESSRYASDVGNLRLSERKGNLGPTERLTAGGIGISDDAVMIELKLGPNAGFIEKLALRKIAVAMALRVGITNSEQELEEGIAAFYAERKFFDTQQIS